MMTIFIYPVYSLIRMSLYQSLGIMSLYVGFDDFAVVLNDPLFLTSVRNNLVLMACVPVMIVVALVLALLLYEQRKAARSTASSSSRRTSSRSRSAASPSARC